MTLAERVSSSVRCSSRRGVWACRRGVSAVEFALIAPLLMVLFMGAVDISRAVTAANRAGYVADSIGELVSQATTTLTEAQISGIIQSAPLIDADILAYGRQIGSTNLPALVNLTISSVRFSKTDATCVANCIYLASTVFSRALAGSVRPCGLLLTAPDSAATTPATLPASTFGPVSLVVVDVAVFFQPIFLKGFPFPGTFRRSSYFRPRQVTQVNAATNCPGS
jgi:Flp pilus assembly protein TadG